jgi:hypothetical protein
MITNGGDSAVSYTLDTIPPTVTISSTGGLTNQASQAISGTVTVGDLPHRHPETHIVQHFQLLGPTRRLGILRTSTTPAAR